MSPQQYAESYDFRLVTRAEFEAASDVPNGIAERVANRPGDYVLYDPLDDDEGFCLVGNDPEALINGLKERVEH